MCLGIYPNEKTKQTTVCRIFDLRTLVPAQTRLIICFRGQPPWDYEDYLDTDPDFLNRYLRGRTFESPGIKVRVIQNPVLFSVRFRDDLHGTIAGLGGVILVTEDGGHTWEYRKLDRKQAVFGVGSVAGRSVGVGEKGLVRVATDDALSNWSAMDSEVFPDVYTFMRDIGFDQDGKLGLIVGQEGQILRSTDAGFSWTRVLPPASEPPEHG